MSISRVLIANRGEIAVRVIRACRGLGIEAVLAVSEADRDSLAARMADRAVCIGPASSAESYLSRGNLIAAALGTGADAIHPGYGFLAEDPEFADCCAKQKTRFIGPGADSIRLMGNKLQAREIVRTYGVPVVPGSSCVPSLPEASAAAAELGFPLLLKAAAGGGGRGIKLVPDPGSLTEAFRNAAAEARAAFGDDTLYLERYLPNARHIEVQVLGDRFGNVVHLGDRDCSLQRRHQKIVEEAPAPFLPGGLRKAIHRAAVTVAGGLHYENAGTVEFLVDQGNDRFYFLEMNTRIQVEHPVTEMITGIDLVQEQIRIADGRPLSFSQSDIRFKGHAVECRINAESPVHGFRPSPGLITQWRPPQGPGLRIDTHCFAGYRVPPHYDSLLAKLIAYGADRVRAVGLAQEALRRFSVSGIETTIPFLCRLLCDLDYVLGRVHTRWVENNLDRLSFRRPGYRR